MQYLLMDYVQVEGWAQLTKAEQEQWLGAYRAFKKAMTEAGALKNSQGLQPAVTASTVRTVDGKIQVLDGPYADTKEQLGGFHLIDVPDHDAAIAWATRSPTAIYGIVEVRPINPMRIE